MTTVFIPATLRRLTNGADRVNVSGETVGELIDALDERFPGMRDALVRDGDLVPHFAVSIDDVLAETGIDESVGSASEVHFVPPLGGG